MSYALLGTVAVVVLFAGYLAGGGWTGTAESRSDIGYVDFERIWDAGVLPALEGPLQRATEELQAEFDVASEGMSEPDKQSLFEVYQDRLLVRQQELLTPLLDGLRSVIGQVADEQGIRVVLDESSVVHGGVDLTALVLAALEAAR